jgi:hypothetical protein
VEDIMKIATEFLDKFKAKIYEADQGARLGSKSKWAPWQTESSLKPIVDLLGKANERDEDLKWAAVASALRKIPAEKWRKYKSALEFIQVKAPGWDFAQYKTPGFDKFQTITFDQTVPIVGRRASLRVRGEGMTPVDMHEIIANLLTLCQLIKVLASDRNLGSRLEWFAPRSMDEVHHALDNLDQYLHDKCSVLTFKRLAEGMRCDSDVADPGLSGQVVPSVMLDGEDRPDFRRPDGYKKVPSGLRIFLGPLYFGVKDRYDGMLTSVAIYRFQVLAHELTHKIIKTTDQVYELVNCQAIKSQDLAVMCADSWAYFLTQFMLTRASGEHDVRRAMASRRAALHIDDD